VVVGTITGRVITPSPVQLEALPPVRRDEPEHQPLDEGLLRQPENRLVEHVLLAGIRGPEPIVVDRVADLPALDAHRTEPRTDGSLTPGVFDRPVQFLWRHHPVLHIRASSR
jgi:hypothetical protein